MRIEQSSPIKPEPYPYRIPEVKCPEVAVLKRLDPWHLLEFIRIEVLLRSSTVHRFFTQRKGSKNMEAQLFMKYGFMWSVLKGSHHRYLTPNYEVPSHGVNFPRGAAAELWARAGILDMTENTKQYPSSVDLWRYFLLGDDPRFLYLQIDTAYKPETILKALRPILVERHKKRSVKLSKIPNKFAIIGDYFHCSNFRTPWHPVKKPRIKNLKTWLDYIICYDLRERDGLTFGQIATRVYPPDKKKGRARAETAVKRVRAVTAAAERNEWPPAKF